MWLIPAHAGKTARLSGGACRAGAHPRSRGENPYETETEIVPGGSSPLTRGKLSRGSRSPFPSRLIPAHAGKTSRSPRTGSCPRAHPRSRGENFRSPSLRFGGMRSSPLTRGKHNACLAGEILEGLIPAHAGKTPARPEPQASVRAHPRSRGENLQLRGLHDLHTGSSPLTRGKRLGGRRGAGTGGLIPAHAGKTASPASGLAARRAHPRSRGENDNLPACTSGWEGSSPLTRGKLD